MRDGGGGRYEGGGKGKKKGHVCAERGNINHEKKEEKDRKSNNIFPRAQAKEKRGKFNGVLSFKT